MLDAVLQHLRADASAALGRLKELLRIPSVSTDPRYGSGIAQGAQWVAATLRDAGLEAEVLPTAGHPCVLATTPERELLPRAARAASVLFYGHYDVQPPDPEDKWITPAFEPTVRDGAVYARGASDDKGQVMTFIEAIRAWKRVHGGFPARATVLIEGEEECGSVNLHGFLERHRGRLKADVTLVSDTAMWDRETVAITYGLRGLLYFDVQLHGPARDLHSGVYGGVLANPATMLAGVLGRLHDEGFRVTIPGFYDDVIAPSAEERAAWAALGFDPLRDCLRPVGVDTPFGEAGYDTLERKWARPTCDVNGLYGGYMGQGAKTVIPSFAGAKVSFRLAYRQDPQRVGDAFVAWLEAQEVGGCRWRITDLGRSAPVMVATDSPHVRAAKAAILRTTGRRAVMAREGATIPVIADFKATLGMDSLLIGFGLHDDALHAPNEKFDLACFDLGCRTYASLLWELGEGH